MMWRNEKSGTSNGGHYYDLKPSAFKQTEVLAGLGWQPKKPQRKPTEQLLDSNWAPAQGYELA
jgi:hypothetical protein